MKKRRYVAYLDILGFRTMLEKYGAEEVASLYRQALRRVRQLVNSDVQMQTPGGAPQSVPWFENIEGVVAFSDSIFIFANERHDSLAVICHAVYGAFQVFLSMGMPLRGAISFGEIEVDLANQIYVGDPIVRAYHLAESLDVIGLVIDSTIQKPWFAVPINVVTQKKTMRRTNSIKSLAVPVTGFGVNVDKNEWPGIFKKLRRRAGYKQAGRYKNSEQIVAAMLNIDPQDLT
jgi:hypothetical protein